MQKWIYTTSQILVTHITTVYVNIPLETVVNIYNRLLFKLFKNLEICMCPSLALTSSEGSSAILKIFYIQNTRFKTLYYSKGKLFKCA